MRPGVPTDAALPASAARASLSVQFAVRAADLPDRNAVRRWVRRSVAGPAILTVRFVDEAEGRRLNACFRGRDAATNVLSFPYAREPLLEGDLVLCVPVVRREAAAQGKALDAHFAHLVVHGILHLQGFDHGRDDEARLMEDRERAILHSLGFSDPY